MKLCNTPLVSAALISFLTAIPLFAGDIQWQSTYEGAMDRSAEESRVIFVAVNMIGERANERMLSTIYQDGKIGKLAKLTVNLVATNCGDQNKASACKPFKPLTPSELRALDIRIRKNILRPDDQGYVVAPQHVFLAPDGEVILSVPYAVTADELEWCFVRAIQTVDPGTDLKMSATARAPRRLILGDVYDISAGTSGRTLTREKVLELIEELRRGTLRGGKRASVFRQVITADEPEARDFVLNELRGGAGGGGRRGGGGRGGGGNNRDRRAAVLHQIGVNSPPSYWEVVAEFIADSSDEIRNEAAVALEQIAAPAAHRAIASALRKEKVAGIEKNLLRALGASGAAEKSARATLLKVARKDRESLLRVNAIISLGYLIRDEEVVEFLTETFHSGEPREQAAAVIAMGLSREEMWLDVLEPGSASGQESSEEHEDAFADLEDGVVAAVYATKQVLSDGGLAPLEDPMTDTADDELRRERLFGRAGGGGGNGGEGGGRGGEGGGGGRGDGDDPEDE